MSGTETISYAYLGIAFNDFFVHPEFAESYSLGEKESEWDVKIDFNVIKRTPKWDIINVSAEVKLLRKKDKLKISKLKVESSFKVFGKMSFDLKYKTLALFINATIGHFQGGYYTFHTNPNLKSSLPQVFFHEKMIEGELKKKIYEKWK